jgi:chemotaxis protein MotA
MGFVGALIVIACVFGGFLAGGGSLMPVIEAAPLELVIIFGAALGGFIIGNPMKIIKLASKMTIHAFTATGPQKQQYVELLQMLFQLFQRFRKDGPQAVEAHIENPEKSDIFSAYPKFLKNHHAVHFLCDTMKITLSADLSQYDVDDLLDGDIKAAHGDEHSAQHAVQAIADGLPGLGIVAAVLGIIKTMSHLTEGPEKIGELVAHALVGTMLGVFLAYGFFGPLAVKIVADIEAEGRYLQVIKAAMVALQRGAPPLVCVEFARRTITSNERPSFEEIDKATKEAKKAAA